MDDLVISHIESSCRVPTEQLMERSISYLEEQRYTDTEELPDPIDYLKNVMEERNLRNCDLKIYIGSSGHVGSVLKRRSPLSLRMIRNLHRYLGIPAEILIQPYDLSVS